MAIYTKVENLEDEWERWITCTCTHCQSVFEENTEDFDLDTDETFITCPQCQHHAPLTMKTNSF